MPQALLGRQWTGTHFVDNYKRTRNPTPNELLAELKGTAWTCISMNAGVCASFPPQLYVATRHGEPQPKCATQPSAATNRSASSRCRTWPRDSSRPRRFEEVTDHPLLTLLQHGQSRCTTASTCSN